jgi:hypothetical protein
MKRQLLWGLPGGLYLLFCFWYTDWSGPLTESEIDQYAAAFATSGAPPERVAKLRQFMAEDSGRQFIMVNLLDMADDPGPVAGVAERESADQLMGRYMEHMWPALLRRACHPVFLGNAVFQAMDLEGIEGAESWSRGALMRYRSRRDMAAIATNPAFAGPHRFKMASLDKTIAFPVETQLYYSDPRLLLLLLLVAITAVVDIALYGRQR